MSSFSTLGINPPYIKALEELAITKPTEIQEKTIPTLLNSKTDFIGLAQTGTGKTAAFGLPLLHHVDVKKGEIQALILSPTRELVQQIKKQLFKFTKHQENQIYIEAVFGGEKIDKQLKNLNRTTHVVVATPGRLIDLVERKAVNLNNITTLVMDEADEMLSMGFKTELNTILKATNGSRNIWLFSATMPDEIKEIVKNYMSPDAAQVVINKNNLVNSNITHQYFKTTIQEKTNTVIRFLEVNDDHRGIIFCRTKLGTQKLASELKEEGFSVGALEGDMQQKERDKVMRAFKNESLQVLVSTDVSARGIDVRSLEFIIHHQLPESIEYYTHRSGRTARAGKKGLSLALILHNEIDTVHEFEKKLNIRFSETKL